MRLFDLFLRRAGVSAAKARLVAPLSVSRLTVICPRHELPHVRRQIYSGLNGSGIRVANLEIDHSDSHHTAQACVTITCPPELRSELMQRARLISDVPGVLQVKWAERQRIALN
ncbi:hypothetical protein [Alcaligenes endophyticus]|uniref:MgtC-like C-terminal domain-containing protein n=1 Tax=Alcaligenes endophyticus TaxID=1929088 RepID=A0ABT8EH61_9BURK|nr:hypothetical protein [Alcaligenes endophyticus]MCX5589729.1 hypothetical protein [Alcaligenes endophyticus]MDN4120607.1 hypothetical protein [Alcaligenes endophyticus]